MEKKTDKPAKKKPDKKKKKPGKPITFEDMGSCTYIREKYLKKHGLTPDVWARLLKAETEATKTKVFQTKDGEIIYSEPLVDHKIRQQARQDLAQYMGIKPPEQSELKVQGVKFVIED